MIMRKKETSTTSPTISRATRTLYIIGMLLIAIPLFYTVLCLTSHTALTVYEVKYYAKAIEHLLAGLAVLSAGCYLTERVARAKRK